MGRRAYVPPTPDLQGLWRRWNEGFETEASAGVERLVGGEGFSELLVQLAENLIAVSRISADFWDLTLRNLRLAGRADINRLAGQLARTEDKLERLLQVVEPLHDELTER